MHREGHVGAALLAYAPVGALTLALGFGNLALLGAGGAVVLAMLPDYDQRVPGLEHRGPTHTVWFALAVGVVLAVLGGLSGAEHGLLSALALAVWASVMGVATSRLAYPGGRAHAGWRPPAGPVQEPALLIRPGPGQEPAGELRPAGARDARGWGRAGPGEPSRGLTAGFAQSSRKAVSHRWRYGTKIHPEGGEPPSGRTRTGQQRRGEGSKRTQVASPR